MVELLRYILYHICLNSYIGDWSLLSYIVIIFFFDIYTPAHLVRPSVRLSVRLSVDDMVSGA